MITMHNFTLDTGVIIKVLILKISVNKTTTTTTTTPMGTSKIEIFKSCIALILCTRVNTLLN